MRYPATVTWCDHEPASWQDYTTCHTVQSPEHFEAAIARFEQDMRRLKFALLGEIRDSEGHRLTFGFTEFGDRAFVVFQPKHLLYDEHGRSQYRPVRWSVASPADATTLPPGGCPRGRERERMDFHWWRIGYDPFEVMPEYHVPIHLVKQAIREYLDTGEFAPCIAWGESADWRTTGE
jgi:hypothetical protein